MRQNDPLRAVTHAACVRPFALSSGPPMPDPDHWESTLSLLERARAGDDNALNDLFARYAPPLRRWASGRLPRWARDLSDTLERELSDRGPLPPDEVIAIGIALCGAVEAVHAAGLLHRDVKCHNVVRSRRPHSADRLRRQPRSRARSRRHRTRGDAPLSGARGPGRRAGFGGERRVQPRRSSLSPGDRFVPGLRSFRCGSARCVGGAPALSRPATAVGGTETPGHGHRSRDRSAPGATVRFGLCDGRCARGRGDAPPPRSLGRSGIGGADGRHAGRAAVEWRRRREDATGSAGRRVRERERRPPPRRRRPVRVRTGTDAVACAGAGAGGAGRGLAAADEAAGFDAPGRTNGARGLHPRREHPAVHDRPDRSVGREVRHPRHRQRRGDQRADRARQRRGRRYRRGPCGRADARCQAQIGCRRRPVAG